ncbi:MAG: hypothetical protein AAB950_00640 [Patescibacteria group bacterium]
MDWKRIKQLMRYDGGKTFVIEDGEPALVVLSVQEYERLIHGGVVRDRDGDFDIVAASFDAERERVRQAEMRGFVSQKNEENFEKKSEHIRLEDLPL